MASVVYPLKNTALSFELDVYDYSGKLLTAATFSARQISKDGGAFATTTNAPVEIGTSGTYTIALTASEMNADRIVLRWVIASAPDIVARTFTVPRRIEDLAFPLVSGRGIDVDASGKLILQATQTGVTIPTVTTLTNAPSDSSGVTALVALWTATRAGYVDLINTFLDATISSVATLATAIKAKTDNLPASPAATGAQMDLVNAPNATAITAIQLGLATSANVTAVSNKLGAWSASGRNTVLGAIQALFRKDSDASVPSDVNANLGAGVGVANNTTDSLEAIRDRGDAAWLTGSGGDTSAAIADAVWDEARADHVGAGSFGQGVASVQGNVTGSVGSVSGAVGSVTGNVGGNIVGTVPDSAGVTILLSRLDATRALLLDNLASLAGWVGTILAAFRAMSRKDSSSADIGGTFAASTDSLEANREKLDTLATLQPITQQVSITESDE